MGQTIKTQSDFNTSKAGQRNMETDNTISNSIEQKIVGGSYSLIGRKMLTAMKSLKYSDKNVRNKEEEDTFRIAGKHKLEDLYYNGPITSKNNHYGIGYESDGLEDNDFEQSKKRSNIIPMDPYDEDERIDFNEEEVDTSINLPKKSKAFETDFKVPYKEFELHGTLKIKSGNYEMPKVPADYDVNLVKDLQSKRDVVGYSARMNAEKRSSLLGENKFTSREFTKPLENKKVFVKAKEEEFNEADIVIEIPFKKDLEKMKRFKAFIAEKNCQRVIATDGTNVTII